MFRRADQHRRLSAEEEIVGVVGVKRDRRGGGVSSGGSWDQQECGEDDGHGKRSAPESHGSYWASVSLGHCVVLA
jgi:hypothetical protein